MKVMMKSKPAIRQWVVTGLAAGIALMQWACGPKAGEAYSSRKLDENKADIEAFLRRNNLTAQQTATNLYYVVTKANANGQKPQLGDEVQFSYVKYRLDGIIIDSSASATPPRIVYNAYGGTLAPGLFEGVQLLKEGEQASLLMPFNLQNANEGTLLFPAFSPARYEVKVLSIRTEDEQIDDYLRNNQITGVEKTSSGLRFKRTLENKADTAQAVKTGQSVTMKYVLKYINGTVFQTNNSFVFKPGEGTVIKAFDEAVLKMKVGEKSIAVLPSSIGYGAQGSYNQSSRTYDVPPYSPLVYELEVVSAK